MTEQLTPEKCCDTRASGKNIGLANNLAIKSLQALNSEPDSQIFPVPVKAKLHAKLFQPTLNFSNESQQLYKMSPMIAPDDQVIGPLKRKRGP